MAAPRSSTSATSVTAPAVEQILKEPDVDITAGAPTNTLMQLTAPPPPAIYACIAAVTADLAKVGVAKDRQNEQQHYRFRGIDDIYNALAPIIAKHGLVIVPRIVSREVNERVTKSGTTLFYVTLCAEFNLAAAKDGSWVTVRTYGEAMDSGDKATNKAMSACYKYAALMTFCVPTEGDNDTENATPEPVVPKPPKGFDAWFDDLQAVADEGLPAMEKMWKASAAELRVYANAHRKAEIAAAKKRATTPRVEEPPA